VKSTDTALIFLHSQVILGVIYIYVITPILILMEKNGKVSP